MAKSGVVRRGSSGYTYDFGVAIARSTISDLGILSAKALTLTAAIYGLATTMTTMENSLKRNKIMFGGYLNTIKAMQFAQDKLLSGQSQFNSDDIVEGMRHVQNAGLNAKKTFDFVNKAAEATGQSFAEMGAMLEGAINSGSFQQFVNLGIMTQNQTKYFERYTAGTNAMRNAVMRFLSSNKTLADAMKNTMTTIQGQVRRMKGFAIEFARAIVGDPTDPNSFYNQIKNTITQINEFLYKNLPAIKKFAFTIGQVLSFVVRNVAKLAKYVAEFFGRQIGSIRLFMGKFQDNIMSMLLWLELVKVRIVSIFQKYKDEIKFVLKAFLAFYVLRKVFLFLEAGILRAGLAALKFNEWLAHGGRFAGISTRFRAISLALAEIRVGFMNATAAAWQFVIAVAANPITWIVVAVVALVAWVVYLVRNWKEVRKATQSWGDSILLAASFLMPIVGIPMLMAKHWQKFKAIFVNLWTIMKNVAIGVWISIKNAFKSAVDFMGKYFGPVFRPIIDAFTFIWDGIKNFFNWIKSAFNDGWIGKLLGGISDFMGNAADSSKRFAENQAANSQFSSDKKLMGTFQGGVKAKSENEGLAPDAKGKKKDNNPILAASQGAANNIPVGDFSGGGGGMTLQSGAVQIIVQGSKANPSEIAREVRRILNEMQRTESARKGNG